MANKPSANGNVDIGIMKNDIAYIRDDIAEIKKALQTNYVTRDQFLPVKRIAYGAVSLMSLIVVGAIGAIATLIGKKP